MNLVRLILALSLVMVLMPFAAFAEVPALPEVDPLAQLFMLVTQFKVMKPLMLGMAAVVCAGQMIKKFVAEDFKYKRLLITALSIAYGIMLAVSQGLGVTDALILILITGGGASALYEGLKGVGLIKGKSPA